MSTVLQSEKSADYRLSKTPMRIPLALQSLLSTVKEVNMVDTLNEVLDALKAYIYHHKLFDSRNPRLIHCENDALGKVLGVTNFSLVEIKRIVLRQLLQENRSEYPKLLAVVKGSPNNKRKDAASDTSSCFSAKFLCSRNRKKVPSATLSTTFWSSSEEDGYTSSGESSSEVEFGKIVAINQMYDIEYEIETDSSASSISSVTDSDSEIEDIVSVAAISEITASNSDEAFWADRSSDECFDSDVEISNSDKWECKTCKSLNKPPMRYCLKCWEERSGWVAQRRETREPRQRKKTRKRSKIASVESEQAIHNLGSCSTSQKVPFSSSKLSSQDHSDGGGSEDTQLCILCCSKPRKAVIVHGKTGHQISCYRCARKLLSSKKRCPVCRRQIDRVIHLDS